MLHSLPIETYEEIKDSQGIDDEQISCRA